MPDRPLWPGAPVDLPIEIEVDGEPYVIGAVRPQLLLVWLAAAGPVGMWWRLFPHNGGRAAGIEQRLVDPRDPLDYPHLYPVAEAVLPCLYGMPPELAHKIARRMMEGWVWFSAWCARRAVDPEALPIRRLLASGLAWLAEVTPAKELERELFPPVGTGGELTPSEQERNARAWLAAAGQ